MGRKCCVPNCNTGYQKPSPLLGGGYAGVHKPEGVTVHSFPLVNEELKAKWLKAIPRKD